MERSQLPLVGERVTLTLRSGERLDVVTYTGRQRDIFFLSDDGAHPWSIRLEADEACALAGLLCEPLSDRTSETASSR